MPPKIKITRDDIVNAAVKIVQKNGAEALNARTVASYLECSTQPIFSNFSSMDELKVAVIEKADMLCQEYMQKEVQRGEFPVYKANGMAYILFAKEEKELFKLLYMRDRTKETETEESKLTEQMEDIVKNNTGLNESEAKLFHLETWAFVHGIATMFATGFLDLDWSLVSKMLTDCYKGLVNRLER